VKCNQPNALPGNLKTFEISSKTFKSTADGFALTLLNDRRVFKLPERQILTQPAISVQGLAKRLDVSVRTARRLILAGELSAHRIGRQWRVEAGRWGAMPMRAI
jgi:excisionase family DNA binding protein